MKEKMVEMACAACEGTGFTHAIKGVSKGGNPCNFCHGTGKIKVRRFGTLKRIESTELYSLKNNARKMLRVRPKLERNKKNQGETWAALNNYKWFSHWGSKKVAGVFLELCNWRGQKLMLSIHTQDTTKENSNEIHQNRFFDFNEFDYALETMESEFKKINSKIFPIKNKVSE
jgi:hypothetical protein